MGFHCTDFHETLTAQPFVKNSYIEFHENPPNGLAADARSQDEHGRHVHGFLFFFYFVKNA